MQKETIIGIDVSSATLDICVRSEGTVQNLVINNEQAAIKRFLKSLKGKHLVIGMENTGRYNWALYEVLACCDHKVFVIPPLHLKKSLGLVRGKNDKIDAIRIAVFTEKNQSELTPWKQAPQSVRKLRILLTERNSRVKLKGQLLKQQADYPKMKALGMDKLMQKLNTQLADQVEKQIKAIEKQIQELINTDTEMKKMSELMRSVPGVGKVLTWTLLAKTGNFTTITDPGKMACYSGVVPFDHQSGTSIKGRPRVSQFADKTVKSILHMAAMSAIRLKNDLRTYYLRKVAEGKNKMSVLNAVRNKIIHRVFAVIKNQIPYQIDLIMS